MPQAPPPINNPLMRPFVVLALPGMYLFYKYNQYKRKRKENAKRRLTERELQHLNNKIDKLLNKLEESEPELATCQEEECVICIHAKATMQTSPCGHQVVCRKCFVKTIQIAVSQRLLPLRCVICRAKILRLKTGPILPSSASGYSVNSRSSSSVPQSDSLYSVSSGSSSISSTSCSSEGSAGGGGGGGGGTCCGGHCLGGAYPRQPTGALRRSQRHAMKMKLQEYCRPSKDGGGGHHHHHMVVNRLPPIKEIAPMNGASPTHTPPPPPSTRIRCAQKIVTQLEIADRRRTTTTNNYKYEKLPQTDDADAAGATSHHRNHHNQPKSSARDDVNKSPPPAPTKKERTRWWQHDRWRTKSEERNDNKKNEIAERHMVEMVEKQKREAAAATTSSSTTASSKEKKL